MSHKDVNTDTERSYQYSFITLDSGGSQTLDSSESFEELVKVQIVRPTPKAFDLVVWDYSLKLCISNEFPSDSNTAGVETIL